MIHHDRRSSKPQDFVVVVLLSSSSSFYHHPSSSVLNINTTQVGDVLVVDGLTHRFLGERRGDLVSFRPPQALQEIARRRGQDLQQGQSFVKRVACVEGDRVLLSFT